MNPRLFPSSTIGRPRRWAIRGFAAFVALAMFASPPATPPVHADMTPELLDAIAAVTSVADRGGSGPVDPAYEHMRALLFKNNGAIQTAALNGYLTDAQYQALQRDYAALNEEFAGRAAADAGAKFTKQVSKSTCYSPGTDSDYIVKVKSVEQIAQMQTNYNNYIDSYLANNGVITRADEVGAIKWSQALDTDFMADPDFVSSEDFVKIADLNNAAYDKRMAADTERLLRAPRTSPDAPPSRELLPENVREYTQQMKQMANHRQEMLTKIREKGGYLIENSEARADWFKQMALEEKYIARVEEVTDTLRLQNGLEPINWSSRKGEPVNPPQGAQSVLEGSRAAKSIAALGSKRTVYTPEGEPTGNFGKAGAAASVAENSLQRASFELASSLAEVAKKNAQFRATAPGDIAVTAQDLTPAQKGFLLDQLRQGGNDRLAADVAAAMRSQSGPPEVDPSFKDRFKQDAAQAKQQAAQPATPEMSPIRTRLAEWDQSIASAVGIENDPSKITNLTRRQFNELGQKWLPRANLALGEAFKAKELVEAGVDMSNYLESISAAMDASVPDEAAQQHLENAQRIAQGMMVKGTWGASLLTVMEAFPTVGAVVGTWAISYNGTRWVMEATGADKAVTFDLAVGAIDAAQQAAEAVGDEIDRLWGGETRREQETRRLLDAYQRAMDRGEIMLRPGMSMDDLASAVKAADVIRIRNQIVQPVVGCQAPPEVTQPAPAPAVQPGTCGTFSVSPGAWTRTGVFVKKGAMIKVKATGTVTATKDLTAEDDPAEIVVKKGTTFTPDGGEVYWYFGGGTMSAYGLFLKVGPDVQAEWGAVDWGLFVGANGDLNAGQDGEVLLGITRGAGMGGKPLPGDAGDVSGSYSVTVIAPCGSAP